MPIIQIPKESFDILMKYLPWLLILALLLKQKKKPIDKNEKQLDAAIKATVITKKYQYKKLHLIPEFQMTAYQRIKQYADANNLIVCPKVYMRDLIAPEQNLPDTPKLESYVRNHVDFVLCTPDFHIIKIIMLINQEPTEIEEIWMETYQRIFSRAGHEIVFTEKITDEILRCT